MFWSQEPQPFGFGSETRSEHTPWVYPERWASGAGGDSTIVAEDEDNMVDFPFKVGSTPEGISETHDILVI